MREEPFDLKVNTIAKQIRIIEGAGHKLRPLEEAISSALDWLKSWAGLPAPESRIGR